MTRPPILDRAHRGMLLDVLMFVANLLMMQMLTGYFLEVYRSTSETDQQSQIALGGCCVAMLVLPTAGAILKRWHYHQRLGTAGVDRTGKGILWGCLCNPIFYFCLNLVVMAAIQTLLGDMLFGKEFQSNGGLFTSSIILGTILIGVQTFIVYRYFSAPKSPPRLSFLRSKWSETVGDICIYLNMALFQAAWNLLTFADLGAPADLLEFAGRLFFLCFFALLIYFPPRIFYLAEDINRPKAWLTMLLANAPVIVRVLFGIGATGGYTL